METVNVLDENDVTEAPVGPDADRSRLVTIWHALTRFRRTRPFWGCLVLGLGGWFVLNPVIGSAAMALELGVGGMSGYLLGGGMMAAALVALVLPAQRHFPAILAAMMSVASLPLANLGGWLIGMIFGIVGSGMVFAWTPYSDKQLAKIAARKQARAERKALRQQK